MLGQVLRLPVEQGDHVVKAVLELGVLQSPHAAARVDGRGQPVHRVLEPDEGGGLLHHLDDGTRGRDRHEPGISLAAAQQHDPVEVCALRRAPEAEVVG